MATVRPSELPAAGSVASTAVTVIDTGSTVEKATPVQLVDSAIPLASQAEAQAGTDNVKRVTPLRVAQAITALGVSATALAATGGGQGADLIGWLQDGVGAEARTVRDKVKELAVSPEDFGARGDGITNDTLAFQKLAAAINTAGGGAIEFGKGKTYIVGGQTFGAPPVSGRFTGYTGIPDLLLEFTGLTKDLIIRGNGAKIDVVARKYGTFNSSGTATANAVPYYGPEIAIYYDSVISLDGCSGFFHCTDLEIDGNSGGATVGGQWGDTGWQLGGTGIKLIDHTGGCFLSGVNAHHHTADGIQINGEAAGESAALGGGVFVGCKFNYNSRLGMAAVGGRGYLFTSCEFNWNANSAVTGSTIASNPATGVDFEAEGGKVVRDFVFDQCDFIGNLGPEIIADSGPSGRIVFRNKCRFVSTVAASYVIWPNKPFMAFDDCLIAGTTVSAHKNPLNPAENVQWSRCTFSSSADYSPTGTLGMVNNLLFDIPTGTGLVVRNSLLDFDRPGVSANGSTDEIRFEDCTFLARQGSPGVAGRYAGRTEFIDTGTGTNQYAPGGALGKVNGGNAEDSWAYTTGGVRTVYPATLDRKTGLPFSAFKGATGARPATGTVPISTMYLDTTLDADGKPIWWTGVAWVDATGATV